MRIGCNIVFKHLHFDFDFQPFETSSIIWVTMVATMLGCICLSPPDHGHAYMVPRLLEVGFSLFSKRRKLYGHRPWAIATRHASSHTANDCMETWLGTCFRCFQRLARADRQWCALQSYSSKMDRRSRWRSAKHVSACLFLQLNLSGMCFSLDMFWHVYFVNRTCQACLLLRHVLARLFLLSNLPGMLCQPNMCVLFWTITGLDDTFAIVCLRIDDIIVYNALFATLTAQWLYLLCFHICVARSHWRNAETIWASQTGKKNSGTWSLEWLHCKLLVSSFNLKCQYMFVYARSNARDRMSERNSERMPLSIVTVCSRPDSDNTDGGPRAAWLEAAAVCSEIWPPYTTHPGQCPWCHLAVQLYLKWSSAPFQAVWKLISHCIPVFSQSFKIANAGFFIQIVVALRVNIPLGICQP